MQPKTILIAEDNDLNLKLFNDLMQVQGYATLTCHDGREALRMIREHRPDLVLMDIQLPEISGLDVIIQIKADAELKAIPVIAITAFAMKGDEERIRASGCEGYLPKPTSVVNLVKTVAGFLDKK
ncbi:MAG TPA: response regulator [Rhodospirillaceae bacterium]|nr:response regulator [Rhodospirillaceae bacterium]